MINTAPGTPQTIWWLTPVGLILGLLVPIFLAILYLGEINSPGLMVRGARFLDIWYVLLGLGYILLLAITSHIGSKITLRPHGDFLTRDWRSACWVLGSISLAAYLFWFREILFSPGTLFGMLTGSIKLRRDEIGHATGITSLVNVTPAFFALISYVWSRDSKSVTAGLRIIAACVLSLTLLRVYAWSERLALIEAIIAIGVPAAAVLYQRLDAGLTRKIIVLAPVFGFPILVVYFGVAEYFRSWQSDFYQGSMPFWEFALGRLGTYYYTSLNNGAGVLETQDWPTYKMENIFLFLHKAPALVGAIFRFYTEASGEDFGAYLLKYGDPEFNNPSGIYSVIYDIGIAGAAIYFSIVGLLAGALSTALAKGQARGVLLYPSFFITLLEVYRYPYLGHSRTFTLFLGVFLAIAIMSRHVRKEP